KGMAITLAILFSKQIYKFVDRLFPNQAQLKNSKLLFWLTGLYLTALSSPAMDLESLKNFIPVAAIDEPKQLYRYWPWLIPIAAAILLLFLVRDRNKPRIGLWGQIRATFFYALYQLGGLKERLEESLQWLIAHRETRWSVVGKPTTMYGEGYGNHTFDFAD